MYQQSQLPRSLSLLIFLISLLFQFISLNFTDASQVHKPFNTIVGVQMNQCNQWRAQWIYSRSPNPFSQYDTEEDCHLKKDFLSKKMTHF